MKKILFPVLAAVLAASGVQAQDWAKAKLEKSPRHTEFIKIKHDNREVESFIAYPEVKEKATAVVVIHEIFGLSDWARELTDELAAEGYIAIAPDLLWGKGTNGGGTVELGQTGVQRAIGSLPQDQITADLNAAVAYVSKLDSCNGKVVVVGFCWGGGQTIDFASKNKDIKAALSFYGPIPNDVSGLSKITAPLYGFYGENDNRVDAGIPRATDAMKAAGKFYEPVIYTGAGHGFMRGGEDPQGREADKKARDDAWKRVREILKKI